MSPLCSASSLSSAKSGVIFLHSEARKFCAHDKMHQLPSLYGSCVCTPHQLLASPSASQPTTPTHKMPQKDTNKWSDSSNAMLLHTMASEKAKGNWGDNGPKKAAYTVCEKALKDSEKISGGTPKTAKTCRNRWNQVCTSVTFIYTMCIHISLSRSERISRSSKGSESFQDSDGMMPRRSSQPQTRCGMPTSR